LALRNDGTVWAWGANVNGELGDGTNVEHHTPVQVREPLINAPPELAAPIISPPRPTRNLIGVKAVAAGTGFSLALKIDGTVRAWGANYFGQLGDNTNSSRGMPVGVPHVSGVVGIAAGEGHSLAFGSNAIVQAWGYNTDGQLGDNTQINHAYAVQAENLVENLSAVTAVDGGGSHSVAVGPLLTLLTIRKIVMHGAQNRRFNLTIDGIVVGANVSGGSTTPPQTVSPGAHKVGETGTSGTPLSDFEMVIGGDCATDGTVNLALGDRKICTITNYDHAGGCSSGSSCCDPGDGLQGCQRCSVAGHACE